MNRLLVIVGMLASGGLAYATAGWESPPVRGSGVANRGRMEFVHASAPAPRAAPDAAPHATPGPGGPATPIEPAAGAAAAAAAGTEPTPAPGPSAPPEPPPETPEVTDVTLCIAEKAVARSMPTPVRVHLDSEGVIFWVTKKGATELPSQDTLSLNLGRAYGAPVIIVPDRDTLWQEVKKSLDTAHKRAAPHIYLGCGSPDEPTLMRTLEMDGAENAGAEGPRFVIKVKDGGDAPEVEIDGEAIESFPVDLALAWNAWKRDHPGVNVNDSDLTPVVLDAHRFTPMSQVVQVLDVLRGLGITHELHAGEAWIRKRQ